VLGEDEDLLAAVGDRLVADHGLELAQLLLEPEAARPARLLDQSVQLPDLGVQFRGRARERRARELLLLLVAQFAVVVLVDLNLPTNCRERQPATA